MRRKQFVRMEFELKFASKLSLKERQNLAKQDFDSLVSKFQSFDLSISV